LKRSGKGTGIKEQKGIWKLGKDIFSMDSVTHRAFLNDREIELTSAEWKILCALTENPGIVFSRDHLLGECLDYMAEGSERTIDTHIKNIRKKLGKNEWIETVRGWGYRFSGKSK